MSEGRLYAVDTTTHTLEAITISGGDFAGGAALRGTDGILLEGHTLYAVQAPLNRVAVVQMAADYLSGEVTGYITEPFASNAALQAPTTIARFGNSLYAVTFGGDPVSPDYIVRMEVTRNGIARSLALASARSIPFAGPEGTQLRPGVRSRSPVRSLRFE